MIRNNLNSLLAIVSIAKAFVFVGERENGESGEGQFESKKCFVYQIWVGSNPTFGTKVG